MLEDKQRILIIGNGGAGKSTFSKFLGSKTNLPVYHLDKLFWKPGWEKREKKEWNEINEEIITKDRWILDGNYTGTFRLRALRSDLIYFFDYSRILCLYGIYKRTLKEKFSKIRREDIADGCDERFPDLEFIKFVWLRYNKEIRPIVYDILEELNFDNDSLVIFRNRKELNEYKNRF